MYIYIYICILPPSFCFDAVSGSKPTATHADIHRGFFLYSSNISICPPISPIYSIYIKSSIYIIYIVYTCSVYMYICIYVYYLLVDISMPFWGPNPFLRTWISTVDYFYSHRGYLYALYTVYI